MSAPSQLRPSPPQGFNALAGEREPLVLVGGGLQNALVALATLNRNPGAELRLIERETRFGGNHTWCFHQGDVASTDLSWLDPLIEKRWPAYDVKFPGLKRRIHETYSAITSERLNAALHAALSRSPNATSLRGNVVEVGAGSVRLEDGADLKADFVIDARGPNAGGNQARHFQKFLGIELNVTASTAPEVPTLMDATVRQLGGFRFMYVLPLAPDRVLVEDTCYSESPTLEPAELRAGILNYAHEQGMAVRGVVREETGVLPLPTRGLAAPLSDKVLRAGYAGGFFHPTTGYSFPSALRIAGHVASCWPEPIADAKLARLLARHRSQVRYCLWLNRLLFGAFAPERRFEVLERFYRLPQDTIRHFYALEMSTTDRARIVCGRPPKGFSALRLIQTRGQHA